MNQRRNTSNIIVSNTHRKQVNSEANIILNPLTSKFKDNSNKDLVHINKASKKMNNKVHFKSNSEMFPITIANKRASANSLISLNFRTSFNLTPLVSKRKINDTLDLEKKEIQEEDSNSHSSIIRKLLKPEIKQTEYYSDFTSNSEELYVVKNNQLLLKEKVIDEKELKNESKMKTTNFYNKVDNICSNVSNFLSNSNNLVSYSNDKNKVKTQNILNLNSKNENKINSYRDKSDLKNINLRSLNGDDSKSKRNISYSKSHRSSNRSYKSLDSSFDSNNEEKMNNNGKHYKNSYVSQKNKITLNSQSSNKDTLISGKINISNKNINSSNKNKNKNAVKNANSVNNKFSLDFSKINSKEKQEISNKKGDKREVNKNSLSNKINCALKFESSKNLNMETSSNIKDNKSINPTRKSSQQIFPFRSKTILKELLVNCSKPKVLKKQSTKKNDGLFKQMTRMKVFSGLGVKSSKEIMNFNSLTKKFSFSDFSMLREVKNIDELKSKNYQNKQNTSLAEFSKFLHARNSIRTDIKEEASYSLNSRIIEENSNSNINSRKVTSLNKIVKNNHDSIRNNNTTKNKSVSTNDIIHIKQFNKVLSLTKDTGLKHNTNKIVINKKDIISDLNNKSKDNSLDYESTIKLNKSPSVSSKKSIKLKKLEEPNIDPTKPRSKWILRLLNKKKKKDNQDDDHLTVQKTSSAMLSMNSDNSHPQKRYLSIFQRKLGKTFCFLKLDNNLEKEIYLQDIKKVLRKQNKTSIEVEFISDYLKSNREIKSIFNPNNSASITGSKSNLFDKNKHYESELINKVAKNLTYEQSHKDHIICRYGDKADKFYIILKGCVSILIPKEESLHLTITEYFYYLCLLSYYEEYELIRNLYQINTEILGSNFPYPMEIFLPIANPTHHKSYFLNLNNNNGKTINSGVNSCNFNTTTNNIETINNNAEINNNKMPSIQRNIKTINSTENNAILNTNEIDNQTVLNNQNKQSSEIEKVKKSESIVNVQTMSKLNSRLKRLETYNYNDLYAMFGKSNGKEGNLDSISKGKKSKNKSKIKKSSNKSLIKKKPKNLKALKRTSTSVNETNLNLNPKNYKTLKSINNPTKLTFLSKQNDKVNFSNYKLNSMMNKETAVSKLKYNLSDCNDVITSRSSEENEESSSMFIDDLGKTGIKDTSKRNDKKTLSLINRDKLGKRFSKSITKDSIFFKNNFLDKTNNKLHKQLSLSKVQQTNSNSNSSRKNTNKHSQRSKSNKKSRFQQQNEYLSDSHISETSSSESKDTISSHSASLKSKSLSPNKLPLLNVFNRKSILNISTDFHLNSITNFNNRKRNSVYINNPLNNDSFKIRNSIVEEKKTNTNNLNLNKNKRYSEIILENSKNNINKKYGLSSPRKSFFFNMARNVSGLDILKQISGQNKTEENKSDEKTNKNPQKYKSKKTTNSNVHGRKEDINEEIDVTDSDIAEIMNIPQSLKNNELNYNKHENKKILNLVNSMSNVREINKTSLNNSLTEENSSLNTSSSKKKVCNNKHLLLLKFFIGKLLYKLINQTTVQNYINRISLEPLVSVPEKHPYLNDYITNVINSNLEIYFKQRHGSSFQINKIHSAIMNSVIQSKTQSENFNSNKEIEKEKSDNVTKEASNKSLNGKKSNNNIIFSTKSSKKQSQSIIFKMPSNMDKKENLEIQNTNFNPNNDSLSRAKSKSTFNNINNKEILNNMQTSATPNITKSKLSTTNNKEANAVLNKTSNKPQPTVPLNKDNNNNNANQNAAYNIQMSNPSSVVKGYFKEQDNTVEHKFSLKTYKYHEITFLKTGQKFGDVAFLLSQKRTASVLTTEETDLAILTKNHYYKLMKEFNEQVFKKNLQTLYSSKLFNHLSIKSLKKKFMNFFVIESFNRNNILINENVEVPKYFFIKSGYVELSINRTLFEIDQLIAKFHGNIPEYDIKYKLSNQFKDFYFKKLQNKKVALLGESEVVGLEDMTVAVRCYINTEKELIEAMKTIDWSKIMYEDKESIPLCKRCKDLKVIGKLNKNLTKKASSVYLNKKSKASKDKKCISCGSIIKNKSVFNNSFLNFEKSDDDEDENKKIEKKLLNHKMNFDEEGYVDGDGKEIDTKDYINGRINILKCSMNILESNNMIAQNKANWAYTGKKETKLNNLYDLFSREIAHYKDSKFIQ